jgi:hypothetical protein
MFAVLNTGVAHQPSELWTALNALATFMAVAVALFGPIVFEYLRRPRITVSAAHEAHELALVVAHGPLLDKGPRLYVEVSNEGRRQANDVQVFLSAGAKVEIPGQDRLSNRIVALQTLLGFVYKEADKAIYHESVSIPPGFSKPLGLLARSEERPIFLLPDVVNPDVYDGEYQVVLDVVGSNFKVVRYEGAVSFRNIDSPDEGDPQVEWIKPPRRTRYVRGNPLKAWLHASAQ